MSQAAFRVPAMWLVAGLPAAVVVASFATLAIALRSGADAAGVDPVRRTAQIQETELGPDLLAADRGLRAIASLHDGVLEILPAGGRFDAAAPRLELLHPVDAAQDLHPLLEASGAGWRIPAPSAGHDWNLQLVAADGSWRLAGRLVRGERAAVLSPLLSATP